MEKFSIIIIAQNEESNIRYCVSSCVKYSDDVWVVDSYSNDKTVEIARNFGAHTCEHEFESWGAQRNFALENLDLKYDYLLLLDADEEIGELFARELNEKIQEGKHVAFNVNFDIVFLGKILRHAHENLPVLRVVRKGSARWITEGAREYCIVQGTVGKISARIRHEDRKGIFFWLTKHIRNANREANAQINKTENIDLNTLRKSTTFERPFRILLRRLYSKLPSGIRPLLVFLYRYIFRLGFLDGYPGLVFCILQAFWYNFIIDVRLVESKLGHDNYLPVYGGERVSASDKERSAE